MTAADTIDASLDHDAPLAVPPVVPLLRAAVEGKAYQGRQVLGNLVLTIGRGEIVSLVGPSGCGKSTLLRIIGGLDDHYRGDVQLHGQTQHGPSDQIGIVFQEPRLLPWLSVADNVAFSAGPRHGRENPAVAALLLEVGLPASAHLLPKELSGGMAQRVALARALFSRPDLLLLDEPFSAVDAFTRKKLQDLLLTLTRAHGTAALLVTHDLDEARRVSDRIFLMTRSAEQQTGFVLREVDESVSMSDLDVQ